MVVRCGAELRISERRGWLFLIGNWETAHRAAPVPHLRSCQPAARRPLIGCGRPPVSSTAAVKCFMPVRCGRSINLVFDPQGLAFLSSGCGNCAICASAVEIPCWEQPDRHRRSKLIRPSTTLCPGGRVKVPAVAPWSHGEKWSASVRVQWPVVRSITAVSAQRTLGGDAARGSSSPICSLRHADSATTCSTPDDGHPHRRAHPGAHLTVVPRSSSRRGGPLSRVRPSAFRNLNGCVIVE